MDLKTIRRALDIKTVALGRHLDDPRGGHLTDEEAGRLRDWARGLYGMCQLTGKWIRQKSLPSSPGKLPVRAAQPKRKATTYVAGQGNAGLLVGAQPNGAKTPTKEELQRKAARAENERWFKNYRKDPVPLAQAGATQ